MGARALIAAAAASLVLAVANAPAEPVALELEQALPIEAGEHVEPSGLALRDGVLYTVSDKHDGVVFRLELGGDAARMVPAVTFTSPGDGKLDLEGLDIDPGGAFHLVSEARFRVLRVSPQGEAMWATGPLREHGASAGLFATRGAYLEGLGRLGAGAYVLAAERDPRGLLLVQGAPDAMAVRVFDCAETPLPMPEGRSPDFTGLHVEDGATGRHAIDKAVYALVRNAHRVVQLGFQGATVAEKQPWSYAHLENAPEYAYRDMTYGRGEGLAMDAQRVYIVLDNNGDRRAADPGDRRPQLFILKRPGAAPDSDSR